LQAFERAETLSSLFEYLARVGHKDDDSTSSTLHHSKPLNRLSSQKEKHLQDNCCLFSSPFQDDGFNVTPSHSTFLGLRFFFVFSPTKLHIGRVQVAEAILAT
jgi:hypothetical protein